jgi:two-component system, OmpR family, flagellar system response regulator FtcR
MIIIVDERKDVTDAYCASFGREGLSGTGLNQSEFDGWFESVSQQDLEAVETVIMGDMPERARAIAAVKARSPVPVIAVNETMGLDAMLSLFAQGADDVVRKPVHAREFIARIGAIKRRTCVSPRHSDLGRLKIFFDGRDPEVSGKALMLPRRERRILEYLAANRTRRVSRQAIFNAVYGLFDDEVEESVVESHISKLRKKLRHALGFDPIDTKRFLGYQLMGPQDGAKTARMEFAATLDVALERETVAA